MRQSVDRPRAILRLAQMARKRNRASSTFPNAFSSDKVYSRKQKWPVGEKEPSSRNMNRRPSLRASHDDSRLFIFFETTLKRRLPDNEPVRPMP
jgi:hypothetical protein